MVSIETWGIALMVLEGVIVTFEMVVAKWLSDLKWPYFRLLAVVNALAAIGVAGVIAITKAGIPKRPDWKWVVLGGFFGTITFIFQILAVQVGTPLGDVAALLSINIVIAAILGRAFLGEALRWFHGCACAASVSGAFLVSKPEFLFGRSQEVSSTAWLGYALAPTAGFFGACFYIASRKTVGTSPWAFALSVSVQGTVALAVLPLVPVINDFSMGPVTTSPWQAAGWLGTMLVGAFIAISASCAGSKWCPAAVTATVSTATRMVCGYVTQIILFGVLPDPVTLSGASLMLGGVIMMTALRGPDADEACAVDAMTSGIESNDAHTSDNADDETESLGSFIAEEFAGRAPHGQPVRQRHSANAAAPDAQKIGVI